MLVAAIPQKVTNETMVVALDSLSESFKVPGFLTGLHYINNLDKIRNTYVPTNIKKISTQEKKTDSEENEVVWIKMYNEGDYIENQFQWKAVEFGNGLNMKFSGCEIIATYNACKALGEDVSSQTMAELISMYERDGAVLGGLFGTSPDKIKEYFEEKDYSVIMTCSKDSEVINEIGEEYDTVIVTAYNDENNIMGQIHTVSITKDEGGKYTVHNAYCQRGFNDQECRIDEEKGTGIYVAKEGYSTLQDAINAISNNSPASISVIGISEPEEKNITEGDE